MADIANQTLELLRRFRDETAARFNKVDLSLRDVTEQTRITNAHSTSLGVGRALGASLIPASRP